VEAGVEDTDEMERFRSWVERLPAREHQRWLLRAVDDLNLAVGSALLGEFRRAQPPLAADQGRTVEQLLARAEERRAGRRLESLRQGLRPGWQTSGTKTAPQTGPLRP
jgi:hypothetical protein